MAYVTLILTSFSTYYLPTLSQTHDPKVRQMLVYRVLRLSIFLMVPLVVMVITLKPLVVKFLYTAEFLPSLKIMRWMLIGDYFKVISWVFSFTMVAYADMRTYLWTEILWGGLMLGGAVISVLAFNSLQGIGLSFIVLYITYLGYTLYYVYSRHHLKLDRTTVVQWLIGLALVLSASAQTWNASQVNWVTAGLWLGVTLFYTWVILNNNERQKISGLILNRFKALFAIE
jgi:PST family polysaccharide transporter